MISHSVQQIIRRLLARPWCRLLLQAAGSRPCHLVGGALRDAILDRSPGDLDVVVDREGLSVAERLAALASGRLVVLGGDRFAAFRIVLPDLIVDLWDRQGMSLQSDLARRDFTINSAAVDLRSGEITDPFGGLADIDRRLLRATTSGSFEGDPLRVFRLARLVGQLPDFTAVADTVNLARLAATKHVSLAPERIRSEIELMLETPASTRWVELLAELSLYPELWSGQSGSAEGALRALERLPEVEGWFASLAAERSPSFDLPTARMALLFDRLPAARRGIDPGALLQSFRRRGLLTRRATEKIGDLLEWRQLPRSDGERRWFLHRTGRQWPTVVGFLGARTEDPEASAAWRPTVEELLRLEAMAGDQIFDPPPLLDGEQVQRLLECPPGPRVGSALRQLRRHQVEGRVRTRREAEDFVLRMSRRGW